VGVNVASYGFNNFTYNSSTDTATWTLSAPIANDKLLIDLSDAVSNSASESLAGSWTDSTSSYPSGTGGTAANFVFRFNVLPGDEDQSGTVNILDTTKTLNRQASSTSNSASYLIFADINGDSVINILDTVGVQSRQASSLPVANPITPAVLISKTTLLAPAASSGSSASALFSTSTIGSDSFSQLLNPKDRAELLSA
jgi:hypothetical protein